MNYVKYISLTNAPITFVASGKSMFFENNDYQNMSRYNGMGIPEVFKMNEIQNIISISKHENSLAFRNYEYLSKLSWSWTEAQVKLSSLCNLNSSFASASESRPVYRGDCFAL